MSTSTSTTQQQQQSQHPHSIQTQQLNPRANVFILVNLGCEMLYVIDQRLKAQQIAADKSIQVIHDVTTVLLEPKFIDSLIIGSTHNNAQLLTAEHCKFMLNDIATCSLMRLDELSMEKLWNLMTMIYKCQLYLSRHQHHLLDITFRHLDAVNKLYTDAKRHMLIDFTKNTLLDFWNACGEEQQLAIYNTNKSWLHCFNTKISLLIRLGFQTHDGAFTRPTDQAYYQEFVQTIGDNVYTKSLGVQRGGEQLNSSTTTNCVNQLAELLNIAPANNAASDLTDLQPIDATTFQQKFEQNLQQCNILFEDLDVNGGGGAGGGVGIGGESRAQSASDTRQQKIAHSSNLDAQLFGALRPASEAAADVGFVQLEPFYNRAEQPHPSSSNSNNVTSSSCNLNKQLLDLYSKIN